MRTLLYLLIIATITSCESESGFDSISGSGKAGSMARFAISGDYLYTVSESELNTYNISTPGKPVKQSSMFVQGYAETIFAKDSMLYFGTRMGMLLYDKTNPAEPEYISTYSHIYSCDPVIVHKNVAFVTLNSGSSNCGRSNNRLDIIDVSDPYNPRTIAEHNMVSPRGLGIYNDILFVCDDGLKAYQLDNFNNISLIAKFEVDAYDVIVDDGYIFLIGQDGFHQYKYTNNTVLKVSSILTEQTK